MSSRAIHLETATSLDSSFINALQRFISVCGAIRQLRSDKGTNFVGACRELREAMEEMNHSQLQHHLSNQGCDYITFKHNTPLASHMGGVWEWQIRTVRNVLTSLTAITKFIIHRMPQHIVDIKCIHLMKISLENLDGNVLTSIPKSQRETCQAWTLDYIM